MLFRDTTIMKVIEFLYIEGRPCSLRKISRNVGLNHKNLAKYLDLLLSKGIVEVVYEEKNIRLYRLSESIDWEELRALFPAARSYPKETTSSK
jgi:predicted transcriptional regulator